MATDIIARALAANGGGGGGTDAYTKAETNALLATKANTNETYTKTEVDTKLDTKLDVDMSNIGEAGTAKVKEIIQPELDKKVDKITVQTVTSDANVVTVPSTSGDFAKISMIGGKTVKTKNLIHFPYSYESGYKHRSITFDYDETGMIHVYGTNDSASSDAFFFVKRKEDTYSATLPFVDKHIYTLSIELSGNCGISTNTVMYLAENYTGKNKDLFNFTLGGSNPVTKGTITYAKPTDVIIGHTLALRINRGDTVDFYIRPMLEEGSEATSFEPYFEGLHNAPVREISKTNIIKKPEFGIITKYAEIINRTGYMYESLKSGKYHVSITNAGTKAAFVGVFRNGTRIESTYKSINAGSSFEIDYDILDDDDIVIYQGSTVAGDFLPNTIVSAGQEAYTDTISLTSIVKDLPDYGISAGDIYNYIDLEEMKYHHRVGTVDLGTLNYSYTSTGYFDSNAVSKIKASTVNMINEKYDNSTSWSEFLASDKCIVISMGSTVRVRDAAYTDTDTFKTAMSGVMLNYELAEEEIIDLKPFFPILPVEANGTIEFVNEYNLPVPNTVKYQKGAE